MPDSEEDGEDDADGRVLLDPAPADHGDDEEGPQEAGGEGAQEERQGGLAAREQIAEADPWQGGVGQGVAQEALAPQQREAAEHPPEGTQHRGPDQDVAGREAQLHSSSSASVRPGSARCWSRASVAWVSTVSRPP